MPSPLCCLIPSLLVCWKSWNMRTGYQTVTQCPEVNLISPTVRQAGRGCSEQMQRRSNYLHPSGSVPELSVCPAVFTALTGCPVPGTHEHRLSPDPTAFLTPRGMCAPGTQHKAQTCEFYGLIHQISWSCTTGSCNSVVQAFIPFPWAFKRNEDR